MANSIEGPQRQYIPRDRQPLPVHKAGELSSQAGQDLRSELGLNRPSGVYGNLLAPRERLGDAIDSAISAVEERDQEEQQRNKIIIFPLTIASKSTAEDWSGALATIDEDAREDRGAKTTNRRRLGRIKKGLAAAGFAIATLGSQAPAPASALENPIVTQGQMSSMHLESRASTTALKIETARKAAARYGADAYSSNWRNWTIAENGTAATLNPDKSGLAHRVRVNGAIIDGWLKVDKAGIKAVPVVVNPRGISKMDLQGGTFRLFPEEQREAEFNKLVMEVRIKEKREQPGTDVMPVCVPIQKETRWVNPLRIPSAAVAASRYGADTYSRNPANWEINQYGGAHLKDDPRGKAHRIKASEAVVDGYLAIDRDGINALAIVGAAHGPNPYVYLTVTGATLWQPRAGELNALHWQVKRQQLANERKPVSQGGQPNVLSVSVCN